MALVKFSALVSEMRNKLNGSVFSKNRAGNYLRNKVTPVNPQTTFQANVRGNFGNLSQNWRALTNDQRKAWDNAATNFPYTNIFGDVKYLSGFGLYMKLNNNLLQIPTAPITNPPTPAEIPLLLNDATVITLSPESIKVAVTPGTQPTGTQTLIYATPPIPAGREYVKNQFRLLGSYSSTSGLVEIGAEWTARFGSLLPGQKVFTRTVIIMEDTGQVGLATESSAIIPSA